MAKILFVCLGNICRSPLAEAIFNAQCKARNLAHLSDSTGTAAYHVGENPDHRSIAVAHKNNIHIEHKARQFKKDDYAQFDYILAMDQNNYDDIISMAGRTHQNLFLLRAFEDENNEGRDVPDPYYGGPEGFDLIYDMMSRCIQNLIKHIENKSDA